MSIPFSTRKAGKPQRKKNTLLLSPAKCREDKVGEWGRWDVDLQVLENCHRTCKSLFLWSSDGHPDNLSDGRQCLPKDP